MLCNKYKINNCHIILNCTTGLLGHFIGEFLLLINFYRLITITCLYNFDPLKPHFYIVKRGFTGVYIIFLIFAQKHRLWILIRIVKVDLMSTHSLCFEQKYEKYKNSLSENFQFLMVKFSVYLYRHVFILLLMLSMLGKIFSR